MKARTALKTSERGPDKPSEEDKEVSDYLAANNLPDTPASRVKARNDLATGRATATADAKSDEQQKQLKKSSQQALKNMQSLASTDTPAANYAFLMSFIGMSYEGVRGARLNQAEIQRAALTRSLPDQLQHWYDLWVQKKQLTGEQKRQMLDTAQKIAGTYGGPEAETKIYQGYEYAKGADGEWHRGKKVQ